MPTYLTSVVLEFSADPISDTTPTWVDVTTDYRSIEWWAGVDREGDEPKPGGAIIRLKNGEAGTSTNRRWEPDYVAGQFYPNITTQRRFRLTLNGVQEGVWYAQDFQIDYPAGTDYSEVTVTCSDGSEILALDDLPLMDPPDANSYSDVVSFDEPWGYWRLGDPEGTQAISIIRTSNWVLRGPKGQKRKYSARYGPYGTRYVTRAEAGGIAGPAGVYKSTPLLGAPGLILGDGDTAVEFRSAESEYVRIPLEDADSFLQANALTLEAWVKVTDLAAQMTVISGPYRTAASLQTFHINITTSGDVNFAISGGPGTSAGASTIVAGNTYHLVGTWDGTTANLYVNGVLEDTETSGASILEGDANNFLYIGRAAAPGTAFYMNGVIDEVALYEHALTAERVLAHTQAGAERGFPQQTAGARIADIATHALWSEASIQTTGRDVMPQMKAGQPKLGEIAELAHAEGPLPLFWWKGNGDPVYLGHEWKATDANYNTVQWTFGDISSEIGYEGIELVYDNETYNDVTVTHIAGDQVNVTDTAAINDKGRRANTEYTDVLLMEHTHVESLANAVLAFYKDPALRPVSITVNGAKALTQILDLDLGHLIRVKRRGEGGTPIDRVTHILGKRKFLDASKHLVCTYTLARGFNAADGFWHAGIVGFSEAGSTTVAA